MKKLAPLLLLVLFLPLLANARGGSVHVNGYFRSNGTYVQPHYRSTPDGNPYNNWSFPGNVNPYTDNVAPGNPDTYLRNYYDRSGGSSYSVPSYSSPSPSLNPTPSPSYSEPSYSVPSYLAPAPPSVTSYQPLSKPQQKIYRRAKQAIDLQTGCNSSKLNEAEVADCFRYAYNKEGFDWKTIDYPLPQPQVVSQPIPAPVQTSSVSQTASVIRSSYTMTSQEQALLIAQLQLQIVALQQQLNALLRH